MTWTPLDAGMSVCMSNKLLCKQSSANSLRAIQKKKKKKKRNKKKKREQQGRQRATAARLGSLSVYKGHRLLTLFIRILVKEATAETDTQNEHKLKSGFTFWFYKRGGARTRQSYEKNLTKIGTFTTVRCHFANNTSLTTNRLKDFGGTTII